MTPRAVEEPAQPAAAPLTVAINAQVDPLRAGGVESALQGLVRHLVDAAADERFVLLATSRFRSDLARLAGSRYEVVAWPYPRTTLAAVRRLTPRWQRWRAQAGPLGLGVEAAHWTWWQARRRLTRPPSARTADAFLRAHGASVVHFAYPTRFPTGLPFLYEPWDLQHRHLPAFFAPAEWRARDRMYREGCEQAALVVTATHWTKQDVVRQYGVEADKIAVIPRGPAMRAEAPDAATVAAVRAALDLPPRFAFYPAMTFPHKNHLRLFEALAILRDRDGIALPLVCTGRPYEPHAPAVEAAIQQHRLGGQVRMLGPVSDEALAAIYAAASFVVFPSLFEGLGLPILEALAYGVPVLASKATCLPEVAGEAALFFDPTSAAAIAEALLTAERQPELLERTRAAAPGVLARFSWPKAAAMFVACYHAVAGRPLSADQRALYAEATGASAAGPPANRLASRRAPRLGEGEADVR